MGEVWSAKQTEPVKRKVALKLIKRGMDSESVIRRFEQERQALALMDHPNIAQVLDGGVTEDGQSFFVMELVDGLPLTRFADESKLSTSERLELFVAVCNAVQHAHQKGIVHRDIKPANILVTIIDGKPIPKVIDFGVAKATGGRLTDQSVETQFGAVIGTLEYMAPEQAGFAGSDVDTRADIFSLGVVLYELLTGLRPIDQTRLKEAGLSEMIRVIKEEDPSKPSTRISTHDSLPSLAAVRRIDPKKLTAILRGELDWIVMKCLEKSRDRRYETANGLSRDVQRFLAGEAVEARPISLGYRASKFLQRNKGAVIASTLVLASLVAGVVGTTWALLESRHQAEIAQIEVQTQTAINSFLRDDILAQASSFTQSESIFQPDPDLKVKTALDRAAVAIESRFSDRPLVAAAIHKTVGHAYADLGEYRPALPHLEKAFEAYRRLRGAEHADTYLTQQTLGYVYQQLDRFEEAETHLTEALENSRKQSTGETRESLRIAYSLANCYVEQSLKNDPAKAERAEALYQEVLQAQQAMFGKRDRDVSLTLFALSMKYRNDSAVQEDPKLLDKAEETLMQALDSSSHLPDENPFRINFQYALALVANNKFEYERSFRLQEDVLARCITTFGEFHPYTARAMDSLATSYSMQNRIEDAERLYLRSLEVRRKIYGSDHEASAHAVFALGQFYFNRGNMPKAEVYYRERYDRALRLQGSQSVDTNLAARDLAMILADLGELEEADRLLSQALEAFKSHFEDDHPIVALTRSYQADVFLALGRMDEALVILSDGVQSIRAQKNPHPIELASALAALGECQMRMADFSDAESSFREALDLFTKYIPNAWPAFVYKSKLGSTIAAQERFDEAETILISAHEGVATRRDACPPPLYVETIQALVDFYVATDEPEKAEQWRGKLPDGQ